MRVRATSEDIARIAEAVRRLGADRTIVNEMSRDIRRAGPPIRRAVRDRALAILPHRGGLNRWMARASVRVAVRRSRDSAGVHIVVGRNSVHGRSATKLIDAGMVRHPSWGRRDAWHLQHVRAGFATHAVDSDGADEFRRLVEEAVDRALRRVF
jgi:hypothetical protein